jgi:hypothetical protein
MRFFDFVLLSLNPVDELYFYLSVWKINIFPGNFSGTVEQKESYDA